MAKVFLDTNIVFEFIEKREELDEEILGQELYVSPFQSTS